MPEIAEGRMQSTCVVCGPANEHGLQIAFEVHDSGEVSAEWMPTPRWEGFRGIVHGGIVTTVLDEGMSKAIAATGTQALTCELRVRLRKSVASGESYNLRAWIVERKRRRIATEAVITGAGGQEHARAWGTFLAL